MKYTDPTGMFSAKKLTLGVLQIVGGVLELAATYGVAAAAEAGSAGGGQQGLPFLLSLERETDFEISRKEQARLLQRLMMASMIFQFRKRWLGA